MQHIDVDLVGPATAMAHIVTRLRAMEVLVAAGDLVRNTENPDYGWRSITVAVPEDAGEAVPID
ncbi:hypothetical protein [Yinghuangia soli]|uniref:Uncharacterized protein n=1 Tax=Yinghuangia soli TaxID=2908204 RepID=A0AA41U853_9ACTN|nr:hypothetical protein [Yinghuangia soli]MCF2532559.1 hypothetical protein [Yinghuangia soli]